MGEAVLGKGSAHTAAGILRGYGMLLVCCNTETGGGGKVRPAGLASGDNMSGPLASSDTPLVSLRSTVANMAGKYLFFQFQSQG